MNTEDSVVAPIDIDYDSLDEKQLLEMQWKVRAALRIRRKNEEIAKVVNRTKQQGWATTNLPLDTNHAELKDFQVTRLIAKAYIFSFDKQQINGIQMAPSQEILSQYEWVSALRPGDPAEIEWSQFSGDIDWYDEQEDDLYRGLVCIYIWLVTNKVSLQQDAAYRLIEYKDDEGDYYEGVYDGSKNGFVCKWDNDRFVPCNNSQVYIPLL